MQRTYASVAASKYATEPDPIRRADPDRALSERVRLQRFTSHATMKDCVDFSDHPSYERKLRELTQPGLHRRAAVPHFADIGCHVGCRRRIFIRVRLEHLGGDRRAVTIER